MAAETIRFGEIPEWTEFWGNQESPEHYDAAIEKTRHLTSALALVIGGIKDQRRQTFQAWRDAPQNWRMEVEKKVGPALPQKLIDEYTTV